MHFQQLRPYLKVASPSNHWSSAHLFGYFTEVFNPTTTLPAKQNAIQRNPKVVARKAKMPYPRLSKPWRILPTLPTLPIPIQHPTVPAFWRRGKIRLLYPPVKNNTPHGWLELKIPHFQQGVHFPARHVSLPENKTFSPRFCCSISSRPGPHGPPGGAATELLSW